MRALLFRSDKKKTVSDKNLTEPTPPPPPATDVFVWFIVMKSFRAHTHTRLYVDIFLSLLFLTLLVCLPVPDVRLKPFDVCEKSRNPLT